MLENIHSAELMGFKNTICNYSIRLITIIVYNMSASKEDT